MPKAKPVTLHPLKFDEALSALLRAPTKPRKPKKTPVTIKGRNPLGCQTKKNKDSQTKAKPAIRETTRAARIYSYLNRHRRWPSTPTTQDQDKDTHRKEAPGWSNVFEGMVALQHRRLGRGDRVRRYLRLPPD